MVTASERKRRSLVRDAFWLLKCLAIGLGAGIAWLNIQPYLQLVLWLTPDEQSQTIQFLLNVPLIGWIFSGAGWAVSLVAAIILWGCVQLAQLLPDILRNDRENLRYTLESYRQNASHSLQAQESDPTVVQKLIEFYNNLPAAWLKALFRAQTAAFFLDAAAAVVVYPPITVPWDVFLAAPNPNDVNWVNAGIIVICVFTANILLWIFKIAEQGSSYIKVERN